MHVSTLLYTKLSNLNETHIAILAVDMSDSTTYNRLTGFISNFLGTLILYNQSVSEKAFIYGDKIVLLDDNYNETMTDFVVLNRFW